MKKIAKNKKSLTSRVHRAMHYLDGKKQKSDNINIPDYLKQGNHELRGVYVSSLIQILALSPASQQSDYNSLKNECLAMYDPSDVEYRESTLVRDSERVITLAIQSLLSVQHRCQGKIQSPVDFVQTILNTPYINGRDTIFLVNTKDQNDLKDYLQDSSTVYTNISFEDVKVIWYEVIAPGNSHVNMFLNEISKFLDKSSENSRPFVCRFARVLNNQHIPFYLNNKRVGCTLSTGFTKIDNSGKTITSTSYCYDEVPSSETFAKSSDLNEYLSNVAKLEESLLTSSQRSIKCLVDSTT